MICSFCDQPARYRVTKADLIALLCLKHTEEAVEQLGAEYLITLPERRVG